MTTLTDLRAADAQTITVTAQLGAASDALAQLLAFRDVLLRAQAIPDAHHFHVYLDSDGVGIGSVRDAFNDTVADWVTTAYDLAEDGPWLTLTSETPEASVREVDIADALDLIDELVVTADRELVARINAWRRVYA